MTMYCLLEKYLTHKKKIGIFGFGVSGQGVACLCKALNLSYEFVDEYRGCLHVPHYENYSLCVFSPGFSRRHPWWIQAEMLGIPCFTELDFAASCSKNKIIAVTGTNGKTSTVEMVTKLLKLAGKEALAVGNNGYALSRAVAENFLKEEGVFVCEISSFQAEALKLLHPICTLFTNIAPDHIYHHGSFENYLAAKKHLFSLTTGPIICGSALKAYLTDFPYVYFASPIENLHNWLEKFPYGYSSGQRENYVLVRAFAEYFKIPLHLLEQCLRHFKQPPHRLNCCCRWHTLEFWNDSKSTNSHAVKAALESFKDKPHVHWILGGKSKGEDMQTFPEMFNLYPNVSCIYCIGETGELLGALSSKFKAKIILCHNLQTVFKKLKTCVSYPNYLVLSPGFASLDQFDSFEQRGEAFEKMARAFPSL